MVRGFGLFALPKRWFLLCLVRDFQDPFHLTPLSSKNILNLGEKMSLITCENLTLAYNNVPVIQNLDFTVNQGDYLCIVGENGSGKSTLVKALLGLKKPSAGTITFGQGLIQKEIGYLPQHKDTNYDFPASVWEVVLSGCLNQRGWKPFYSKTQKDLAMTNIQKLGIEEIRNKSFRELSGGQQQRVLLARALCATKKLLLLDEPVAGLDPIVTSQLYNVIKEINDEGITVVMVSHDISASVKFASHILHINNQGKFFGTAYDYQHSELGHAFLCGCDCHKEEHNHE